MGGFFRRLFGKKRRVPLADMCYHGAYVMFPRLALGMPEHFEEWRTQADNPAMMFYAMLLGLHDETPSLAEGEQFRGHKGKLADGRDYVVLQYCGPRKT